MDDPDWMNDFKSPTEDVLMISSSSPSPSPPRDVIRKEETFYSTGKDVTEPNGKNESDDEDSLLVTGLIKAGKAVKAGGKGRGRNSLGSSSTSQEVRSPARAAAGSKSKKVAVDDVQGDDDDDSNKNQIGRMSGRSRVLKRAMESDEEEEDAEEYKPPSKIRKTSASPQVKKNDGIGKPTSKSGRKGKRVSFSEEEDMTTLKRVKREVQQMDSVLTKEDDDDEETAPLSSLVKKDKKKLTGAVDGFKEDASGTSAMMKKEPTGASALISLSGDRDAATHGDDALLGKEGGYIHEEETGEASERKAKPRVSSSLPVIFAEKVHRTKVLLECEGDALDLSGDMGAVGRFSVSSGPEMGDDELLLDLKGIIYKTTIVPSNTFFVVNVGHVEAKVEAIMNDFMQLRPDVNQVEDETIVEGTLDGFAFDLDNEGEPLGTPVTASGPLDSDADEDTKQKKKSPTKSQKLKKVTASKGGKGSRSKGSGKGSTAKKPRAKAKATTKKPSKTKPATAKKVKAKKS